MESQARKQGPMLTTWTPTQRAAMLDYAGKIHGAMTTTVVNRVLKAIDENVLPVPSASRSTIIRYLKANLPRVRSNQLTLAFEQVQTESALDIDAEFPTPESTTTAEIVDPPHLVDATSTASIADEHAPLDPRQAAFDQLKVACIHLATTAARVPDLTVQEKLSLQNLLKHGARKPSRSFHTADELAKQRTKVERTTRKLSPRVVRNDVEQLPPSRFGVSANLTPKGIALVVENPAPANDAIRAGFEIITAKKPAQQVSRDIFQHLVPTHDDRDSNWGDHAVQQIEAPFGTTVGFAAGNKSLRDAWVRQQVLAPFLNGDVTADECAENWRRALAGDDTSPYHILTSRFTPEEQARYAKLNVSTLRRWAERYRTVAERASKDDLPTPSVAATLVQTVHSSRRPVKLTPEIVERVRDLFLIEEKNWSAVAIATFLRETYKVIISSRSIQRLVVNVIADRERLLARGGPEAADVTLRSRLERRAPYPNRCWIIDHSYLRATAISDPSHAFDFGATIRGDERGPGVSNFLWATSIKDACTGRVLMTKFWNCAPTTQDTMLVIRAAILRWGVPEIIYTDNGGDLRSLLLEEAMVALGIQHVLSIPYSPEGRGSIERFFRSLKEQVFILIPGYRGGDNPKPVNPDDLPTLAEIQRLADLYIEQLVNRTRNRTTGKIPAEHYDAEVGWRRTLTEAQRAALVMLLMCRRNAKVMKRGVAFEGKWYWSPILDQLAKGSAVNLHWDPSEKRVLQLTITEADGRLRYLGPAEYMDDKHPAPDFVTQTRAVAAVTRTVNTLVAAKSEKRVLAARRDRVRKAITAARQITDETASESTGTLHHPRALMAANDSAPTETGPVESTPPSGDTSAPRDSADAAPVRRNKRHWEA